MPKPASTARIRKEVQRETLRESCSWWFSGDSGSIWVDLSDLLSHLTEVRRHHRRSENWTSSVDIAIPDFRRRILSLFSCCLRIEDFKLIHYQFSFGRAKPVRFYYNQNSGLVPRIICLEPLSQTTFA